MPINSQDVPPLNNYSEGPKYLMGILDREDLSAQDIKPVHELCQELGGLPLALTILG